MILVSPCSPTSTVLQIEMADSGGSDSEVEFAGSRKRKFNQINALEDENDYSDEDDEGIGRTKCASFCSPNFSLCFGLCPMSMNICQFFLST